MKAKEEELFDMFQGLITRINRIETKLDKHMIEWDQIQKNLVKIKFSEDKS
jgi:hypothetical protein